MKFEEKMVHMVSENCVHDVSLKRAASERKAYIDMAKGIAMLSIIAGHMENPVLDGLIYTYHVPLFLIISGFFFHNKKGMIQKRFVRLLYPYAVTVFVLLLLDELKIMLKIIFKKETLNQLLKSACRWIISGIYGSGSRTEFLGIHIPRIGAIWFLLALFWSTLFLYLIRNNKRINSDIRQTVAVVFIFAAGYFSSRWIWLPLSLQSGMTALLFLFVGYKTGCDNEIIKKRKTVIICFMVWIIAVYISYKNECMSLACNNFPDCFLNIAGAVAGSLVIILLCKKMERIKCINKFLIFFGKYSCLILCLHLVELTMLPWSDIYKLKIPFILLLSYICKVLWCVSGVLILRKSRMVQKVFL